MLCCLRPTPGVQWEAYDPELDCFGWSRPLRKPRVERVPPLVGEEGDLQCGGDRTGQDEAERVW